MNANASLELDLESPGPRRRGSWIDYVEGTARALLERGFALGGADLLIDSDVPTGAGLSASAALEIAVGYALARLGGDSAPDRVKLALAGQAAEHEYVGMQCGIMDQCIAALGHNDHALLIDCRSLEHKPIALELETSCILVCDTKVKHQLATSAYNARRRECKEGVQLLAQALPGIRSLRDVTESNLEALFPELPPLLAKRCRHVVRENARTLAAARHLQAGSFQEFGALMSASHASLRDDYEVSCAELDEAVAAALRQPGVYGSRMTGGGFGGCTVTLLERSAVDRVCAAIHERLATQLAIEPSFFATRACDGVREE
jgi:galactokinase